MPAKAKDELLKEHGERARAAWTGGERRHVYSRSFRLSGLMERRVRAAWSTKVRSLAREVSQPRRLPMRKRAKPQSRERSSMTAVMAAVCTGSLRAEDGEQREAGYASGAEEKE